MLKFRSFNAKKERFLADLRPRKIGCYSRIEDFDRESKNLEGTTFGYLILRIFLEIFLLKNFLFCFLGFFGLTGAGSESDPSLYSIPRCCEFLKFLSIPDLGDSVSSS